MQLLMFSSAEPPANPSASLDSDRAWMTLVATSPSSILPSLTSIGPTGSFGRMSPAFCPAAEDGTLVPSSGRWANSGMGSPTECWTLSTSEWTGLSGLSLKDDGVCSLSDILEDGSVPQRYYLSAKACQGILRRAANRGKKLPEQLAAALRAAAGLTPTLNSPTD